MNLNEMFSHWGQVREDLIKTIEKFSEEELAHVPVEGGWAVGQIMLHIADCEDNWLHGVVRREFEPWIFYPFEEFPTKAAILEKLKAARERTTPFLMAMDESNLGDEYAIPDGTKFTLKWIIWHVLEHEIHHRGELSLILGAMGKEGLYV